MEIETFLLTIQNIGYLAIPKNRYTQENLAQILHLEGLKEELDEWLIPVSHILFQGATEVQIANLKKNLPLSLPPQVEALLKISNGAELFRLHYRGTALDDYWVTRYKILNCIEILDINQQLEETFRSYRESDFEIQNLSKLNYLAFCDVGDGNYLAASMENNQPGPIFFVDHEYAYYPYGIKFTQDAYTPVSQSIAQWLEILIKTYGRGGMGNKFIPV